MNTRSGRRLLLGLACLPVLVAACGGTSSASNVGINALIGHRVAGTPASWGQIVKFKHLHFNFAGESAAPIFTGTAGPDGSLDGISFYEFASAGAASAFFLHPPQALVSSVGGTSIPLNGTGPVSAPSQWLELETCIYEGSGPNPNLAPKGAQAATPTATGKCTAGVPMSGGFASMTQRGNVVFVVNPNGFLVTGGKPPLSSTATLSKDSISDNTTLTENTLALLDQVGIT
jgi:hypothetical protein